MVQAQGSVLAFVPFEAKRTFVIADGVRRVATTSRSPSPVLGSKSLPPLPLGHANGHSHAHAHAHAHAHGNAHAQGTKSASVTPKGKTKGVNVNGTGGTPNGTPRRVSLNASSSASAPASPAASSSGSALARLIASASGPAPVAAPAAGPTESDDGDDERSTTATAASSAGMRSSLPPSSTPAGTPSRKGKEREREATSTPVANGSMSTKKDKLVNGTASVNGTPKGTPKGTPNGTPKGTPKSDKTPKANGVAAPAAGPINGKTKEGPLCSPIIDLSWPEPFASARRAAGLHNGSMACYTNATLQVLLHTPPVLRVALQHQASKCLFAAKHKFCMLCAIREIATKDHWTGKRAYRPIAVHGHLGQIKKGFSKNRQEDTHEFFRFVTDAFQNSALQGLPKELPEKVKRTSWVYRTWGGQVRSRVLCLSCKKPSDTFDSFLDLSLDVPNRARSLADLFKVFCHEDKLDGDNKYNCENCKKKSAATKSMRIAEAPPILTLHLKRFGYSLSWPSRMTKVNNSIDYPQLLDIAPLMTEGAHSGTQYRLFGVTCHHGSSLHYGHYTSYVRGPDGSWYNADDDDVSPVSIKSILGDKSAYLLSYMRISKGEKVTPVSTPAAKEASGPSSPVSFKRRREEESPSPQKRPAGPVRPPLAASYGSSAMSKLEKQYASESDSDGMDAKIDSLLHPRPKSLSQVPTTSSPISRPHHPGPPSPKFKSKFHRQNPKQGIEALKSVHSHSHHGHGNGHKKKPSTIMPFAAGQKRAKSNARYNFAAREVPLQKKGLLRGMRRKGM